MTSKRLAVVALVATLAVVAARVAAPSAHPLHVSRALTCGKERWYVKTLQDRPRLIPARRTTVAHLASLSRPAKLPQTRLPFERHIFSVIATVALIRREADQDLQLVLQNRPGPVEMIAEAPNAPTCTARATAYRKRQMRKARAAIRPCPIARVVGVAFFDFKHGQTGAAPNGLELHPILGFHCLPGPVPP